MDPKSCKVHTASVCASRMHKLPKDCRPFSIASIRNVAVPLLPGMIGESRISGRFTNIAVVLCRWSLGCASDQATIGSNGVDDTLISVSFTSRLLKHGAVCLPFFFGVTLTEAISRPEIGAGWIISIWSKRRGRLHSSVGRARTSERVVFANGTACFARCRAASKKSRCVSFWPRTRESNEPKPWLGKDIDGCSRLD